MPRRESRLLDWLRLMRLPNVFTAVADVAAGHLFLWPSLQPVGIFASLAMASACLYLGGIVLNDVMDVEQDARERPDRPIPAGRIRRKTAAFAAAGLLWLGLLFGWLAAWASGSMLPGVVASILAAGVVAYDAVAKATWLGPPLMGACRGMNWLLGMSSIAAADASAAPRWDLAPVLLVLGYAVYVTGVTWFARTEAVPSNRRTLFAGFGTMVAGLGLLSAFPFAGAFAARVRRMTWSSPLLWPCLLLLIGWPVIWNCVRALWEPTPHRVQRAVRWAILSFVLIDAGICLTVVEPIWWAAGIAGLWVPAAGLGRWLEMT